MTTLDPTDLAQVHGGELDGPQPQLPIPWPNTRRIPNPDPLPQPQPSPAPPSRHEPDWLPVPSPTYPGLASTK